MPRFFDKHSLFHAPNETFSLAESIQLSGKLSRLKNKHVRKNVHASRMNANGSTAKQGRMALFANASTFLALVLWFASIYGTLVASVPVLNCKSHAEDNFW